MLTTAVDLIDRIDGANASPLHIDFIPHAPAADTINSVDATSQGRLDDDTHPVIDRIGLCRFAGADDWTGCSAARSAAHAGQHNVPTCCGAIGCGAGLHLDGLDADRPRDFRQSHSRRLLHRRAVGLPHPRGAVHHRHCVGAKTIVLPTCRHPTARGQANRHLRLAPGSVQPGAGDWLDVLALIGGAGLRGDLRQVVRDQFAG